MPNVSTLRIILGHPTLTDALLRSFFDVRRHEKDGFLPVRRLWLENCRISAGLNMHLEGNSPYGLASRLSFQGLETVRLRRLPMRSAGSHGLPFGIVYSRGGEPLELQDGCGGHYTTTVEEVEVESAVGSDYAAWLSQETLRSFDQSADAYEESPLEDFYETVHLFDQRIYEDVASTIDLPDEVLRLGQIPFGDRAVMAYRGDWLDPDPHQLRNGSPTSSIVQREHIPSSNAAISMLRDAAETLTSLNLDWLLCAPVGHSASDPAALASWIATYHKLFKCRFPHLRSFQWRNCVVPETRMPHGIYLLDHSNPIIHDPDSRPMIGAARSIDLAGLEFMEAHPNLTCLAWPMEHFFSHTCMSVDIASRVQAVVENLGRTLVDLRVDTSYSGIETNSESEVCSDRNAWSSRRRFIKEFAFKMTTCQSIKIEGGMPRDERREIVRALHACPLAKIVMIGVCCTFGNTWGEEGTTTVATEHVSGLEREDEDTVFDLGVQRPQPLSPEIPFEPWYGWKGQPPMLHTLASYHADTITQLKFCGWKGSPFLYKSTPITTPLLWPLKYFHNLDSLIVSLCLDTAFEGRESNDDLLIGYWRDQLMPESTALVSLDGHGDGGWGKELETKYAPCALARRITDSLGPFLSDQAKQREGGVHVRASFSVGDAGGIFDMNLHIGRDLSGDVCLDHDVPGEQLLDERRKEKLESRRWF